MKKLLTTMLLLTLFTAAKAATKINGIYYNLNDDGTAAVTFNSNYSGSVSIPSSVTDPKNGKTYSVTSIESRAFYGCSGLKSITISNSVTSIGSSAFSGCSSLMSIKVEQGNTKYSSRDNCNAIIETTTNTLIAGCKSTVIPNSVTSIGEEAFYGCSGLTSIEIPTSVTSIGGDAFRGCTGLTSITIPNSVTSIGEAAFLHCRGLTSITIPNSVTSIGDGAFSGCTGLTSITIPISVTGIGNTAFLGCTGLTSVTIPNSVTSIRKSTFFGCTGLTSIEIPTSVTSIGGDAFRGCSGLTSVTIPNSVTSIGDGAFFGCKGLTSITIPNSVTSIGSSAFSGCSSLMSIKVEQNNTVYDSRDNCNAIIETATNTLIAGCQNTVIPNSVTSIGDLAFEGCSGLTSVTIPESVTSIGEGAFYYCSGLTSVTIPNSVTSIGSYAFFDCTGLTSVTIPNSVTSIGGDAFFGCTGLTSVTIPNSVTSIGDHAFRGCTNLTQITCTASLPPVLGDDVFLNVNNIPLYVPCRSIDAYNAADQWKDFDVKGIEELNLPTLPETTVSKAVCSGTKIAIAGEMRTITEYIDETHTLKSSQQWECYELDSIVHYVIKVYAQPKLTVANLSANTLHSGEAIALPQVSVSENNAQAEIADQYWEVKLDDADWMRYEPETPINASAAELRYAVETECGDKITSEAQSITIEQEEGHAQEGALPYEFYVSESKKIQFSQGNLQYQASSNTWKFATNQYDYIGSSNNSASQTYSGWIDVFGYGTSGWSGSGATYYQPWNTQRISSEGAVGGYSNHNMSGDYVNLDWGEFNRVSNGGNAAGMWRTLSRQEWEYILTHYKWTIAKVNGTQGFMIVPNNFQCPSGITVSYPSYTNASGSGSSKYYSLSNLSIKNYTIAQFTQLQEAGVVFLPCGGYRYSSGMINIGTFGNYWTGSNGNNFWFTSRVVYYQSGAELWAGLQVRLVHEAKAIHTITWKNYDGTVLKTDNMITGAMPEYTGETPTKPSSDEYDYTFSGWSPTVVAVTGDAVYTAQFTETPREWDPSHPSNPGNYKLTLIAEPEEYGTFEGGGLYEQNSVAEFTAVPNQGYRFTGWADGETNATRTVVMRRDTAFTAYFEPDEYLITFNNHDGQQLQQSYFQYLTMPVYSGEEPQRQPSDDFAYTFRGWEPELAPVTAEAIYTAAYDSIAYPDTVIISDTRNLSEMFIGPKTHVITTETAVVSIPEPVKVKSLTLWVSGDDSPDIDGIENLTAEVVDMVLRLEPYEDTAVKSKWYAFAVPFNVSVAEGIRPENNLYARLGSDFVLDEYDGELRATTQEGWKRVLEGATLLPGHTYMIAVNGTYNFWRLTMLGTTPITEQTSVAVNAYPSPIREHHSGWNGISNIRWQTAYAELEGVRYATIYHNDLSVYEVVRTDEQALHAFCPFFVQTPADGTVNFIETGANMMPRRRGAEQDNNNVSLTISLKKLGSSYADKAYLTTSADKPDHYVIGSDLEKMLNSSATVPQLWLEAYGMKLSAHEALLTEHSVSVPLGIYAPEAGDYIISVSGGTANAQILLIYNGSVIWDLTLGQCQLPLHAGNNEGYSIVVKISDEVLTGIENQESRANSQAPVKFIKDGIIYIQLPDGTLFNANGKLVK